MVGRPEARLPTAGVRGFVDRLFEDGRERFDDPPAGGDIRVHHQCPHRRHDLELAPKSQARRAVVDDDDALRFCGRVSDAKRRNLSVLEPLDLLDIPEDGLEFDEALPETWLDEQLCQDPALELRVRAAGRAKVQVRVLGPVDQRPPVRIRGQLDAPLQTPCVRCLQSVEVPLAAELDFTLFAATSREADQEADGTYEGDRVQLPELLREGLALELPMNPACEDEPACDQRTQAMLDAVNEPGEKAMDAKSDTDPRWRKLAALKKKL